MRIIGFTGLSVMPFYLLKAGFATPVGLFFIGCSVTVWCYFRYGKKTHYSGFLKFTVFGLAILLIVMTVRKIVRQADLGDAATSVSVASRFSNFIKDPTGGGYDLDRENSRFGALTVTFKSISKSPIIGCGGVYPNIRGNLAVSGGHQAIFDYIAHFGLVGWGGYMVFLVSCCINALKRYRTFKTWQDAAAVGVCVMYFIGGVVNPTWYGGAFEAFVILALPFKTRRSMSLTGVVQVTPNRGLGRRL